MTEAPILLFLHGVGHGDKANTWRNHLGAALEEIGYPNLESVRVVAPKFAHALLGWDEEHPLPGITIAPPARGDERSNRREFERRIGALEFRLGHHDGGVKKPVVNAAVDAAIALPPFKAAQNYVKNTKIRAQVLTRILGQLPKSGRLTIVAHSLGSVIAADLLRRLPVDIEIAGLVTIGSPLANGNFDVDKLSDALQDPPTNLQWWLNVWNAPDLVAASRGVSSVFPWVLDFRIDNHKVGLAAHAAEGYLASPDVAAAVGFALFGAQSKELAVAEKGVELPLDDAEQLALIALRYAYLVNLDLSGDKRVSYEGALRQVQANAVDEIRRRNQTESRTMRSDVSRLAFDLSDSRSVAPLPAAFPVGYLTKEQAVVLLTVIVAENVIKPFEIEVADDVRQTGMVNLTLEMGLGAQFGRDVFAAKAKARSILHGGNPARLIKLGVMGLGAVAIVAATGGLALAAAPGLVGAAVITSALASFGPGGMIGGLVLAGSLMTAGGGGIAYGLASASTTAEALEEVIARQLAAAILRVIHKMEPDPTLWRLLADTEIQVRREYEKLDEFSDESAPTLKQLKRKITTVERALKYLREQGLEPQSDYPGTE